MINYHFVYWPGQLNVKSLPQWFKNKTKQKYEEFYPWLEQNWDKFTGVKEKGVTKEEFMNASYGVNRLKGMIKFMMSEDWSRRMPEFREYLTTLDKQRGTDFCKTFPEMADLMNEQLDNSVQAQTGEAISKKQEKELEDGGTI